MATHTTSISRGIKMTYRILRLHNELVPLDAIAKLTGKSIHFIIKTLHFELVEKLVPVPKDKS